MDAQADLSLRWAHRSFCWFCRAAAHSYRFTDLFKVIGKLGDFLGQPAILRAHILVEVGNSLRLSLQFLPARPQNPENDEYLAGLYTRPNPCSLISILPIFRRLEILSLAADWDWKWNTSYTGTAVIGIFISISAASWQNRQCGCAPSENSDQPGHPPSLIRVFAVRSMGS